MPAGLVFPFVTCNSRVTCDVRGLGVGQGGSAGAGRPLCAPPGLAPGNTRGECGACADLQAMRQGLPTSDFPHSSVNLP